MNKLEEIVLHKRQEIEPLLARAEKLRAAALARNDFRSFRNALTRDDGGLALIAEVKKASPSAGVISAEFDAVAQALAYDEAGAHAISVLTDERYFQGHLSYLPRIRETVSVPLLRKDFIVHEAQIYESVVAGADAILLIVACLTQDELVRFLEIAHTYQLDVLVEVHDLEEMERALDSEAAIIGVNNRNLKTFEVDLETTRRLAEAVNESLLLVSESGIRSREDAEQVRQWGADAILVGEALMRSQDIRQQVEAFTDAPA